MSNSELLPVNKSQLLDQAKISNPMCVASKQIKWKVEKNLKSGLWIRVQERLQSSRHTE